MIVSLLLFIVIGGLTTSWKRCQEFIFMLCFLYVDISILLGESKWCSTETESRLCIICIITIVAF